jgi:SAM-dependent methyltransferase
MGGGHLMRQNKYDDPSFFLKYSQMLRSTTGLEEAGEWPAFRGLLPDFRDKRLLDLGCGFGWHCRYAIEHNARAVVGVDISEKMLARAKETTDDPQVTYLRYAIEDIDFGADEFDIVISSLALHYVEKFDIVCQKVHYCLAPSGMFVFSVEHPIYTAIAAQEWCRGPNGERRHWPVDNYQQEGDRNTQWMANNVLKYHRTIGTYVNTLVDSGFHIQKLLEPEPLQEQLVKNPDWVDERRRPMFLLISATKN